jgi:hypothetical protein
MDEDHYSAEHRGEIQQQRAAPLVLDESMVAMYHMFLHPVLPILPATFAELRTYVSGFDQYYSDALIAALECAASAVHFTGDELTTQVSPQRALELYVDSLQKD